MEKGRSLSLLGGKGHVVAPGDIPQWMRNEFRIADVSYEELPPYVYCEYWTLKSLVESFVFALAYLLAGAALTVAGLIYEIKTMIWVAAGLWLLFLVIGVISSGIIIAKIINSRTGAPARKDYT